MLREIKLVRGAGKPDVYIPCTHVAVTNINRRLVDDPEYPEFDQVCTQVEVCGARRDEDYDGIERLLNGNPIIRLPQDGEVAYYLNSNGGTMSSFRPPKED